MSSLLSTLSLCRESMYAIIVSTPSQRQANFPIIHFPFNYNSKAINVCGYGATILYIRFESILIWCIKTIRSLEQHHTELCGYRGSVQIFRALLCAYCAMVFSYMCVRFRLRSRGVQTHGNRKLSDLVTYIPYGKMIKFWT